MEASEKPSEALTQTALATAELLRLLQTHHRRAEIVEAEPEPQPEPEPEPELVVEAKIVPLPAAFAHQDEKKPSLIAIIGAVAEFYEVSVNDIRSARRHGYIMRPRFVAYYLCRELTLRSLPQIGRPFSQRDHTTILHGCNKVQSWLDAGDERLADELAVLRLKIREQVLNATEAA